MKFNPVLRAAVLAVPLLLCANANATNGYFTHGVGTHNKAMAGAGTASPSQSIDAANNPASAALVEPRWDVGIAVFSPRRSYETGDSLLNGQLGSFTIGPNDLDSENEAFPLPHVAKNWKLDNGQSLAFLFYGRGGMNTEWRRGNATFDPDGPGPAPVMTLDGTYGSGTAGVDLMQAFAELAWAGTSGSFSWGIAPVFVIQTFEARGVGSFAGYTETFAKSGGTKMPKNLSNNGHDYSFGYGIKLGGIWSATDSLRFSLAYQSVITMTELDDYSDLFAESGGMDIPSSLRAGVSWDATPNWSLHFDVEEIGYEDVDSVTNPIQHLFDCPTTGFGGTNLSRCLGGNNGAGFGWENMTVYKVGTNWNMASLPQWTFRAGFSTGDQPIPDDQMTFNILAPGVMEEHYTVGASYERSNGHEMSASFMYAPEVKVSGLNNFDPTQEVEFKMTQYELEFAYTW